MTNRDNGPRLTAGYYRSGRVDENRECRNNFVC
jgi:hypothetical protein